MKLIEVENLTKTFKETAAVSGVDFYIEEGEILGFLGPNGAGKSTTINMLISLLQPTKGNIKLKGKSIVKNASSLREILGIVPQEIALYPELTGKENLMFFGKVYGLRGEQLQARVDEIVEVIGLDSKLSAKVSTYSGGMKRRLNIGTALLHRPQLLVMDEPTVGIDPQSRKYILETVKELNRKGMTILYTSHYMEEVEFLCDRIYILDQGKIIASGTQEELKESVSANDILQIEVEEQASQFEEQLLLHPSVNELSFNRESDSYEIIVERTAGILHELLPIAKRTHVEVKAFHVKKPTLEDVFLKLTGRALRN